MNTFKKSLNVVTKTLNTSLDDGYFAINAYSSSFFKSYLKQPDYTLSKFFNQRELEEKQTKSKLLGSIIHKVLLEDEKPSDYAGLLSENDKKALPIILSNVMKNKVMFNIFQDASFSELVITWPEHFNDKEFKCKCKIDLLTKQDYLFDIKTISNLSDMESHIDKYRYDLQMSFYLRGVFNYIKRSTQGVGLLAIETKPPYRNHIFELGESYLKRGAVGGYIRNKEVLGWITILQEIAEKKEADEENHITKLEC